MITLVAAWNLGTIPLGPLLGALQVAAGESARTSVVWMLIAPLITVILYLLSRSRYAWHALHGQVASTVFLVGASMLVSPDRAATATALLVPVLVAALCFGMREVIVIQATAGLMLLAHAFSLPAGQRGILIGSASVLLAGFAITVALVRHRELLIQEREQEARADAERARALLGAGFDGTADIVDGRLVHVSDGFAGALGCKASDLEGRPVDHAFTILAGNGPALDEAVPFLDGEGSLRYLTVLRQVLPHESGVDEVIAIRDQTHTQLHKSNLLFTDRMVAVGTLASGVAHEINNALMTLSGHAELGPLALDKGDTERARGSFLAVQQGSDRIAACVRQLRRFGNGSGETSAPLSLNDVVTSTLQLARHRLRHVAVMDVELANDLPLCNVPEASVGQILMNLLLNALDAIEGVGEPRIRTTTAQEGDWVVVRVQDNGPGISGDHAERIFQPFFTSKESAGSGLGLSISASLAVKMGGSLRLEPSNTGACFCLRLPAASTAPTTVPEKSSSELPIDDVRILLIDDEKEVLSTIEQMLAPAQVTSVCSIEEAQKVWDPAFDLILSDIIMPGGSGLDLRAWIASRHPRMLDRFVLMTGSAVGLEAEFDALDHDQQVLSKPIRRAELLALVRSNRTPRQG